MNKRNLALAVFASLTYSTLSNAQKQVVSADTITYSFATQAPFDRDFYFKLPLKKPIEITSINVYEYKHLKNTYKSDICCKETPKQKNKRERKESKSKVKLANALNNFSTDSTRFESTKVNFRQDSLAFRRAFKKDRRNLIRDSMAIAKLNKHRIICPSYCRNNLGYGIDPDKKNVTINMPPLKPARYCNLVVERKCYDDELTGWYVVGKQILKNDSAGKAKYESQLKQFYENNDPFPPLSYKTVNAFFTQDSIRKLYQKENNFIQHNNNIWETLSCDQEILINSAAIKLLIDFAFTCEHCADSSLFEFQLAKLDAYQLTSYLNNLYSLNDITYKNILSGLITFDYSNSTESTNEDNYIKRLENVKTSIKQIGNILSFVNYSSLKSSFFEQRLSNFKIHLQIILMQLKQSVELINKILENSDDIKDEIKNYYIFFRGISINSNTFNYNFTTRSKIAITPDFGLVYFQNIKNASKFNGIVPYFGFHINLKPIDSDIPWRIYPRKTVLHYFSAFVGASLISIAKQNERSDFINNSPMLAGLGFRWGHVLRMTGGSMLFFKDDPNPLVTHKELAAVPFFGLSVDIRIKDIISSVTQLFKF